MVCFSDVLRLIRSGNLQKQTLAPSGPPAAPRPTSPTPGAVADTPTQGYLPTLIPALGNDLQCHSYILLFI